MQDTRRCPTHGSTRHYLPPAGPPVCIVCRREARALHQFQRALEDPGYRRGARTRKAWRERNPEKARRIQQRFAATTRGFAYYLYATAKQRATRDRLPFDLDLDWIEAELAAAVAAGRVTLDRHQPATASLEITDPARGWVRDNVRIAPAWFALAAARFGAAETRAAVLVWAFDNQQDQRVTLNICQRVAGGATL